MVWRNVSRAEHGNGRERKAGGVEWPPIMEWQGERMWCAGILLC